MVGFQNSSKEYEFSKSESVEEELVSLDENCRRSHLLRLNLNSAVQFANKSLLSRKSRKPSILAVEGFGDLPNLPFSEEWVKRIHIPRKRRLLKTELV